MGVGCVVHAWERTLASSHGRAHARASTRASAAACLQLDPRSARCQAEPARGKHARRGAPEGREGRPPQSAPLERRACLKGRRRFIGGPHRGTARTSPVRTRGESRRGPRALRRRARTRGASRHQRQTATRRQPRMRARWTEDARPAIRRQPSRSRPRLGRRANLRPRRTAYKAPPSATCSPYPRSRTRRATEIGRQARRAPTATAPAQDRPPPG